MKKLLAVVSSIAVCASALAVSVLSYFPNPVATNAEAPDTSSLVFTGLLSSGSYPVLTFSRGALLNSTGDLSVRIVFCPTGWTAGNSSFVYPSSYGTYSPDNGYIEYYFTWYHTDSHFLFRSYSSFGAGLDGKKTFSSLYLFNNNGVGGFPTHRICTSTTSPTPSSFSVSSYSFTGSSFTPSGLPSDVVFTLTGVVGNDYNLWLTSQAYQGAYDEGWDHGQSDGYQDGYSHGTTDAGKNFGMWDLFSNAFGSVANILGIQLFPGFTVGLLISVPIVFSFILWLIHVLKG